MIFPVHFHIGPLSVNAHLVFELLAFFLGYRYFLFLRNRQTDAINSNNRIIIIGGAAVGALIFSRLLGGLEDPYRFFSGQESILYYYQSKTIIGGLLGGLIGVESIKALIGEKKSSGDLFTYPLILAMMIGRIGCFLSGVSEQTYGVTSNLPWAMDLGDGILRHPTALYEIAFLAALWVFLRFLEKNYPLERGALFKIFMAAYFTYRFLVSFIQPAYRFPFGLGTLQIACLMGLIYYYRVLLQPRSYLLSE